MTLLLRMRLVLFLVVISLLTILPAFSAASTVPAKDLRALLITQDDLPWKCMLTDYPKEKLGLLEFTNNAPKFSEKWSGPPENPGRSRNSVCSINIKVAIMRSHKEAVAAVKKRSPSCAVTIPEIEMNSRYTKSFADRLWYVDNADADQTKVRSAIMLLVRSNVAAEIHITHRDGFYPELIFALAAHLGENVDEVIAGKAHRIPVMPKPDIKRKALAKMRLQKSGPLVTISDLARIFGAKTTVRAEGRKVALVIADKKVIFEKDSAHALVDGHAIVLDNPSRLVNGQMMVPLSIVTKVMDFSVIRVPKKVCG